MSKKKVEQQNEVIKIILLGSTEVGKTSIINRFDGDFFSEKMLSTFGSSFISKEIIINEKKIRLDVWDTAGQEQYKALSKLFVKNSKIMILVYDITNKESFDELDYWYNFIKNELDKEVTLGLVGNKADLYEDEKVTKEMGKEQAIKWGAYFAILSAKEDKTGIDKYFMEITQKYLENKSNSEEFERPSLIKIEENNSSEKNDDCCGGGKMQIEKGIKVAFLGANGVGKSNIIKAIRGKEIKKKYEHTKKIQNFKYSYILKDKRKIYVNIIDTNGDDCSDSEIKSLLEECKIFFLVFDFKNRNSFIQLDSFIKKIKSYKKENIIINILGNKTVSPDGENWSVMNEEAANFAKENSCHYESISVEEIENLQNRFIKGFGDYINI